MNVDGSAVTHRRSRLIAAAASAGVIVALSRDDLSEPSRWWAIVATFFVAVVLVWATPTVQPLLHPGVTPGILVGIAAISYACVPETDHFPWLVVVPVTMAVVELASARRLPFGWIYGAAVVVLWAGIYGATGRQSALVGTVFAWWPIVLLSVVVTVRPAFANVAELLRWLVVVFAAVAAGIVSRTGAIESSGESAVAGAAVGAFVSLVAGLAVAFALTLGPRAGGRETARIRSNQR
jgi:hypothetical protein